MFKHNSKPKKVHYEHGTRPGHRESGKYGESSRSSIISADSGIGGSDVEGKNTAAFSFTDIENQRNSPRALREALRAANEKNEQLEAANAVLNTQLNASNRENCSLKREKADSLITIEYLTEYLDAEVEKNEILREEGIPRRGAAFRTPTSEEKRNNDKGSRGSRWNHYEQWRELPMPLYDRPSRPNPLSLAEPTHPFAPKLAERYLNDVKSQENRRELYTSGVYRSVPLDGAPPTAHQSTRSPWGGRYRPYPLDDEPLTAPQPKTILAGGGIVNPFLPLIDSGAMGPQHNPEETLVRPNSTGKLGNTSTSSTDSDSSPSGASDSQVGTSDQDGSDNDLYNNLCGSVDTLPISKSYIAQPFLDHACHALIDKVMEEFWVLFNDRWPVEVHQHAAGSEEASTCAGSIVTEVASSSNFGSRKRRRKTGEEQEDDNAGEEDEDCKPPDKAASGKDPDNDIQFACPFRKHIPSKYNIHFRSGICARSHWPTVARVKEHLYRCHRMPSHCVRCWKVFKGNQELTAHYTAKDMCLVQTGCPPDGFTPEHEKRLKSRKSHGQSQEDRWKELYKILFPNDDIPSPYFEPIQEDLDAPMSPDSRDLVKYEEYRRQELPRLVRSEVEAALLQEMQQVAEPLLENLVNIFQSCQDRLFRSYVERISGDEEGHSSSEPTVPIMGVSSGEAPDDQHEQSAAGFRSLDRRRENFLETIFQQPPLVEDDQGGMNLQSNASDYRQADLPLPSAPGIPSDSGYGSVEVCNCHWPCNYLDPTAKCTGEGSKDASATGALDLDDVTLEWLKTDPLGDNLYDA